MRTYGIQVIPFAARPRVVSLSALGNENFYAGCIVVELEDCMGYNGDATTALGYRFTLSSGDEEAPLETCDRSSTGLKASARGTKCIGG